MFFKIQFFFCNLEFSGTYLSSNIVKWLCSISVNSLLVLVVAFIIEMM